ncbi:DnaA N-terminal domain-containing protein [Peribacillus glennii]|uniref:DnaA N-terminal domain-containing protein n=1 Tax=Peribacillus glennii TaxID=2303991 RepID=A0A372LFM3_9BACI|nr:DnaA N-terminal domain-containing protein [Peribacillus glennii]RFU65080.1 hypothetical protein D0466_03980 [Peribacillus glennii]
MNKSFDKVIYSSIDKERIKVALVSGNLADAAILFKYSVLSPADFIELQMKYLPRDLLVKVLQKDRKGYREEESLEPQLIETTSFKEELSNKNHSVGNEDNEEMLFDLWGQVLSNISRRISTPSFETWFKDTDGEVRDEIIIVHCGNSFQLEWLKERYGKLIGDVIQELTGQEYEIKFIVSETAGVRH